MYKILGNLCLVAALISPLALAKQPPEQLQRIDEVLQAQVDDGKIAGAVVQIMQRGKLLKSVAVGLQDRENEIPMQPDTIFRIASQTKAIVSTAVLMLQERGLLTIAQPVGEFLPEYLKTSVAVPNDSGGFDTVPANRPITIRDLLTHTAGIGYGMVGAHASAWKEAGIQGWYFADRSEPIRETVRRIASLPFDAQPGTAFVYGYNTDILGALVEEVSGQKLDAFLRDNVFMPLGMTDTHFYLPPEKADRLAVVYGTGDDGKLERLQEAGGMEGQGQYVTGPRMAFSGGAGLLSTVPDYLKFLEAIRNGGKLGGKRILGRKSVELMASNHLGELTLLPGAGFGLGFLVIEDLGAAGGIGSEGELSWGGAYSTSYWIDPKEEIVGSYMIQLLPSGSSQGYLKTRAVFYSALE